MTCTTKNSQKCANRNHVDVVIAAEIAYLGHKSTCEEFQRIHERSFPMRLLLASFAEEKEGNSLIIFSKQHKRT